MTCTSLEGCLTCSAKPMVSGMGGFSNTSYWNLASLVSTLSFTSSLAVPFSVTTSFIGSSQNEDRALPDSSPAAYGTQKPMREHVL